MGHHVPLRAVEARNGFMESRHKMSMSKNETFIIEVHETENATWQGEIIWANEKRRQYFRSALELLRLMDSVLAEDSDKEKADAFPESETLAS